MVKHCADNLGDRQTGAKWERNFGILAAQQGKCFTPHQIGRESAAAAYAKTNGKWNHYLLPDVTIWSSPGEHHEIKHKNAHVDGTYGLERYRLDALISFQKETKQTVLYTIHDWELAGASNSREEMRNEIDDWLTCSIEVLSARIQNERSCRTYVNGQSRFLPTCFWPTSLWWPLNFWWQDF